METVTYLFKSCAQENITGSVFTTNNATIAPATNASNFQTAIDNTYQNTPLQGLVTAIGYGWQKFIVPKKGKIQFTVRGASGGCAAGSAAGKVFEVNPITGAVSMVTGTKGMNRGGRGAKLQGSITLPAQSILYILVGLKGSSNNFTDAAGAGGGGASVVLLDNPLGKYTFVPVNRKVDVLFVAGGGGGGFSIRSGETPPGTTFSNCLGLFGADADYTNGINTNGGSVTGDGYSGFSGAGLTGNGLQANFSGSSTGQAITPSLLSGTPSNPGVTFMLRSGGWGGGGWNYVAGAGGGGYSGGSPGIWVKASKYTPAQGGTSYINPLLCEEIFRGYATVDEDAQRNCANPFLAYGAVELAYSGRSEGKFILALDSDGYKYFDGLTEDNTATPTNTWQLLPTQAPPIDDTYEQFGKAEITNISGLQNQVKFLVSSVEPEEVLTITGLVNSTIIKMNQDISMADVSELVSMTVQCNLNNTLLKFALSKDNGHTWQTYNSGTWVDIDITNKTTFKNNGYDMAFFSTIPIADWQKYNAKTIRFAFCAEETGANLNTFLSQLTYTANLIGSWRHCTDAQVTYEYITDDTVEVMFKESGNYKVNYLDSIT